MSAVGHTCCSGSCFDCHFNVKVFIHLFLTNIFVCSFSVCVCVCVHVAYLSGVGSPDS